MRPILGKFMVRLFLAALLLALAILTSCTDSQHGESNAAALVNNSPDTITYQGNKDSEPPVAKAEQSRDDASPCGNCPYAKSESGCADCQAPDDKPALAENGVLDRIVLLTTSRACACTMRRCEDGEASLNAAVSGYGDSLTVERVDHSKQKQRAGELIEAYPASMLPVLYFLDRDGKLLDQLEGEFDKTAITSVLEKLVSKDR